MKCFGLYVAKNAAKYEDARALLLPELHREQKRIWHPPQ